MHEGMILFCVIALIKSLLQQHFNKGIEGKEKGCIFEKRFSSFFNLVETFQMCKLLTK